MFAIFCFMLYMSFFFCFTVFLLFPFGKYYNFVYVYDFPVREIDKVRLHLKLQHSKTMADFITVLSQNCRGLKNMQKRRDLFQYIR